MNSIRTFLCLSCAVLFLLSGCIGDGAQVRRDQAAGLSRLGIISMAVDRVGGDRAENLAVQRDTMNYALECYARLLRETTRLDYVRLDGTDAAAALTDIRSSAITRQVLADLAERNRLSIDVYSPAVMAYARAQMTGDRAEMERQRDAILVQAAAQQQERLAALQAGLAGAPGLPVIPHSTLNGSGLRDGSTAQSGTSDALQIIMVETLKQFCRQQGLDGVLVVYNRSLVGNNEQVRHVMSTGRTLGHIKLNPTLVLITPANGMVIDYGSPMLDDLSPMKLLQPVYTGPQEHLQVTLTEPENRIFNAYAELIDSSSAALVRRLAADLRVAR